MFKKIAERISGLTYDGKAFYDSIGGMQVYYYRDKNGKRWLKSSRFGFFKVAV